MAGSLDPAVSMFKSGGSSILRYWWVIAILLILGIAVAVIWWIGKYRQKNGQWTHKLIVKIELPNGDIDENEKIFKMRRWKHKDTKTPPLFELEKPLIGSRIFVELEKYTNTTSYTVVLGNDGRLYVPTKIRMSKDKGAMEVSVKHAGIDRSRQDYNNRFEQMNATPSKIDVLKLMQYGIYVTAIIVLMILGLNGIEAWEKRAGHVAESQRLELEIMNSIGENMESMESISNTIALILPELKDRYGNNLHAEIERSKILLNQS